MEVVALYLLLPLSVLLVLGVPIAFSLGLSCAFFLALINIPALELVPRAIPMNVLISEMYGGVSQFALLALPMFVLSGELMYRFLIIDRLIDLARKMVGWVPGGLAHATIAACDRAPASRPSAAARPPPATRCVVPAPPGEPGRGRSAATRPPARACPRWPLQPGRS